MNYKALKGEVHGVFTNVTNRKTEVYSLFMTYIHMQRQIQTISNINLIMERCNHYKAEHIFNSYIASM